MQTLKAYPRIIYQDAKGTINRDPKVLTPPLVGLMSCKVHADDGIPYNIDQVMDNCILTRNAFKLNREHHSPKVDLHFTFCVMPPTYLDSVLFEGPRGCTLTLEGETTAKHTLKLNENGKYSLNTTLPHAIIHTIKMEIKGHDVYNDAKKNFILFSLATTTAPIIASLGMALHNHEASMDCTLVTQDAITIRFHRSVLAARSAYFDKLFFGEFQESKTDGIPVLGSANAWQCIRSMMYKQMLGTKNNDALIDTLEVVYQYELDVFVQPVWETLQPMLDGFTAVRSLRLAGLHQNNTIGVDSMRYIQAHITTLICDCEWVRQYASVLHKIGGMPQAFVAS